MTLNRNQFFIILFLLIVLAFCLHKLVWLASANSAKGIVSFTGHGNLGAALGITTYPVIKFFTNTDSIYFNGNADLALKEGEIVNVLYQEEDPSDAKINSFMTLWGDTLAYSLGPLLVFVALFLMPDVFPKNSLIRFSRKHIISIVQANKPKDGGY